MLILRVGWFYFHRGQIVTPRTKSLIVKIQALNICKQCKMWTRIKGILDLIHIVMGKPLNLPVTWFLHLQILCTNCLASLSVGYCPNTMLM